MKKVTLLCLGKIKEKFLTDGIAEYAKRLQKYCDFKVIELADYPDREDSVRLESALIIERLSALSGYKILFDIAGELVSSPELSKLLNAAYCRGNSEVMFIIGASSGVDERVRALADKKISFGRVTYPHQLMRLIASEQIYRAFTIADNAPYHK